MKTLHPTKMRIAAEYARSSHHVEVDPDHTLDDVLRPGYWAHHVDRVNLYDLIDVINESFDVTLRVTSKGKGFVETRVLRKWESEAPAHKLSAAEQAALDATIPDGYVVDHTPKTLWRVRLKDGGDEIIRSQKSKADAIAVAIAHSQRVQGIAA